MDYVDDDGMGNVVIYFMFKDDAIVSGEADSFMYDAVEDLKAHGIDVQDHSAELDEGHSHGGDDLDVGHQDDEPGMLKSTSYEIATYAAKLYKKLAKYDQVDGEVDFPNWWQSKLILAKDYVSKAYHYLDSEEKQPIIDKLALEHAINEGTDLYDGDKFSMKRFAGPNGIALQITAPKLKGGGYEYIQIDGDTVKEFARAAVHVAQEFHDVDRQFPVNEKIEDKELPKGKHSVSTLQKVHGIIVDKMKELNDLRKKEGGDHMYQGGSEPGKHSVMDHLKALTKKKKQVEDALDKAVANVGRGQELNDGKYKSDAQRKAIYAAKAEKNEAELSKAEKNKLKDMSKSLKKSSKGHAGQAKYIDKLVK